MMSGQPACPHCYAPLCPADEQSLGSGEPDSRPTGSLLDYLLAFGAGAMFWVGYYIFAVVIRPADSGGKSFVVFALIYAGMGFVLAARRRVREWLLALCLSAIYLIGLTCVVYDLLRLADVYGGWFWTNKFYFSSAFLMVSLPVAAFLGARFGSRRTLLRLALVISLLGVSFIATYYARSSTRPLKTITHSFNLTGAPPNDVLVKFDLGLGLRIVDEPMSFRYFPSADGGKGGWSVTVLQNKPTFTPTTHLKINIDGKELDNFMWPINQPDGSSHLDYSQEQDYRHIVNWRIGPNADLSVAMVNAQHISMTWGNADIVLSDQQVAELRSFVRAWRKLLRDEGVLCTNPNCVPGRFNPKR